MNAQEWERLRNNWNDLLDVYPDDICRNLFQNKVISATEKEDITNNGTPHEKMEKLLFLLKRKPHSYSPLISAIKPNHGWIVADIEKTKVRSDPSLRSPINPDSLNDNARQVLRKNFVNGPDKKTQLMNVRRVLDLEGVFQHGGAWDDGKMLRFLDEEFVGVTHHSTPRGIIYISNIAKINYRNETPRSRDKKEVKLMKDDQHKQSRFPLHDNNNNNALSSNGNRMGLITSTESQTGVNSTTSHTLSKGLQQICNLNNNKRVLGTCPLPASGTQKSQGSCGGHPVKTSRQCSLDSTPARHDAAKGRGRAQRQSSRDSGRWTTASNIKRQRSDPTFSRPSRVISQLSSPNSSTTLDGRCGDQRKVETRKPCRKVNLLSFGSQVTPLDWYPSGHAADIPTITSAKKLLPLKRFHLIDDDDSTDGSQRMMEEAIKFISACLNDRRNGTIYFGISESGQIVGVNGLELKPMLESFVELAFTPKQRDIVLRTIHQIRMVPVVKGVSTELYVIEIDVLPSCSLVKNEIFWTKMSAISYNFRKHNHKSLMAFSEQAVLRVVPRREIKNYKKRHLDHIQQRFKEETIHEALTCCAKRDLYFSKNLIFVFIPLVIYFLIQFSVPHFVGYGDIRTTGFNPSNVLYP